VSSARQIHGFDDGPIVFLKYPPKEIQCRITGPGNTGDIICFHCIESATGHGMFGIMQRAHDNYRSVVNRLTGQGA